MNIEPKGYLNTFATVFGLTAVPMALLWSVVMQVPFEEAIFFGFPFGLMMGAVSAHMLKGETITTALANKQTFMAKVNTCLAQMDYYPDNTIQGENYFTFLPTSGGKLSVGPLSLFPNQYFRIFVQLETQQATVVGPSWYVKRLQRCLQA